VKKSLFFQVVNRNPVATSEPQAGTLRGATSVVFVAHAQQIGLTNSIRRSACRAAKLVGEPQ
jgi:hypothetical protein